MSLALWHWHIEISSKCALKCPRCARSEVPETLVNTELSLEFFKRNFTLEFILSNVEKISFCGDDGDPIYATSLIPIIKYIKSIKPVSIVIVTNGSYKPEAWWEELSTLLTVDDHVHFSLDGWDNTSNNQYRVNSDWDSILLGVKILRKNQDVFLSWDAIGFSFNEHKLADMQHQARALGFDYFQLTKSTKFGGVYPSYLTNNSDILQPSANLVRNKLRFTREITSLSGRIFNDRSKIAVNLYATAEEASTHITPICYTGGKGLYISSVGKLYPCCWVANRYNHNSEWQQLSIDLNRIGLYDAVRSEFWASEFTSFKWAECQAKCNKSVSSIEYCSKW